MVKAAVASDGFAVNDPRRAQLPLGRPRMSPVAAVSDTAPSEIGPDGFALDDPRRAVPAAEGEHPRALENVAIRCDENRLAWLRRLDRERRRKAGDTVEPELNAPVLAHFRGRGR